VFQVQQFDTVDVDEVDDYPITIKMQKNGSAVSCGVFTVTLCEMRQLAAWVVVFFGGTLVDRFARRT
jgi:hypothetical protein